MKAGEPIRPEHIPGEILKWSTERPIWQQDALRRLVVKGELSAADLSELLAICKRQHGLTDSNSPVPDPDSLRKAHFPEIGVTGESITLKEVCEVANSNALAPGQKLRFAPAGLTI